MFTNKTVWNQVCSSENEFLTSAIANGHPLPPWKVSLGSDKVLMSYYLFIFSYDQHVQHMMSHILLSFLDFDKVFDHFFI